MMLFSRWLFWSKNCRVSTNSCKGLLYPYCNCKLEDPSFQLVLLFFYSSLSTEYFQNWSRLLQSCWLTVNFLLICLYCNPYYHLGYSLPLLLSPMQHQRLFLLLSHPKKHHSIRKNINCYKSYRPILLTQRLK